MTVDRLAIVKNIYKQGNNNNSKRIKMTEITNPDGNKEKEEKGASITLAKGLCKKPHHERPLENGGHLNMGGNSFQRAKHCYRESDFWAPNK